MLQEFQASPSLGTCRSHDCQGRVGLAVLAVPLVAGSLGAVLTGLASADGCSGHRPPGRRAATEFQVATEVRSR